MGPDFGFDLSMIWKFNYLLFSYSFKALLAQKINSLQFTRFTKGRVYYFGR